MYRVIGADQKEYGPVSADELRRWMAEGRVNGQTLALEQGGTDWKPLSAFPEFAGISAPPLMRSGPPPFPSAGAHPLKNSGMAVAGLVCSVLGLMCCGPVGSILGLVFSSIGLMEINRNRTQLTGKSMAVAGIILSVVGLLVFVATFALAIWPGLWRGMQFHRHWHL